MSTVNSLEEITRLEETLHKRHIIMFLFARPSLPLAKDIINDFEYMYYNSQEACSIYPIGFMNTLNSNYPDIQKIETAGAMKWYFSNQAFIDFKRNLEQRLKWRYSGGIELMILQSNPNGKQILNFQNYVVLNIDYGLQKGYIEAFPNFMEALVRSSRKEVDAIAAIHEVRKQRFHFKSILLAAFDEEISIRSLMKKAFKDQLFYKTSTYHNELTKG